MYQNWSIYICSSCPVRPWNTCILMFYPFFPIGPACSLAIILPPFTTRKVCNINIQNSVEPLVSNHTNCKKSVATFKYQTTGDLFQEEVHHNYFFGEHFLARNF